MSILPNSLFGRRRSEPHRSHIWDLFQDHGFGAARTSTPHMAFPSEPSPIVNSHIEWKETPEAHVCKAHLPGLKRSDVRVEVDDDRVLSIICSKSVEMEEQGGGWHRVEVSSGQFVQRVMLPENSKVDHVKAYMDNGVLTVKVPKHRVVDNRVRNVRISHA
ncbi:18.1 kDa class I heat shock protein-like [Lotus japonicus]|uniref:18.1 kDa class I heat shock protein-like n=1 Tax=Lotus japonicus TaxID=34305 RepID=UPI002589CBBE|nr:18.1 kDa class I heat shock protein-like [Lotus japonicus]